MRTILFKVSKKNSSLALEETSPKSDLSISFEHISLHPEDYKVIHRNLVAIQNIINQY